MKPDYVLTVSVDDRSCTMQYSRAELAAVLRDFRRDGARGTRFVYPFGSEWAGWIVKREKRGWSCSHPAERNEWRAERRIQQVQQEDDHAV